MLTDLKVFACLCYRVGKYENKKDRGKFDGLGSFWFAALLSAMTIASGIKLFT